MSGEGHNSHNIQSLVEDGVQHQQSAVFVPASLAASISNANVVAMAQASEGVLSQPSLAAVNNINSVNMNTVSLIDLHKSTLAWQTSESIKNEMREKNRISEYKAEVARREEETARAKIESAVRDLKDESIRVAGKFMHEVSLLESASERQSLTKVYLEVNQHLQENPEDLEEANDMLNQAIKKLGSYNTERQNELMKRLKVKKRKVMSAVTSVSGTCSRCGGGNHSITSCYAEHHVNGSILQPNELSLKRRAARGYRQNNGMNSISSASNSQNSQNINANVIPYQQLPGYQAHFPPQMQPMIPHQQGHHVQQSREQMRCFNCNQYGHKQWECRAPQAPRINTPVVQQPPVPGSQVRLKVGGVSDHAGRKEDDDVVMINAETSNMLSFDAGVRDSTVTDDDSILSFYAAGGCDEEEEEEEEERHGEKCSQINDEEKSLVCNDEIVTANNTKWTPRNIIHSAISSDHDNNQSSTAVIDMSNKMPADTISLRKAMLENFIGKKKLQSDEWFRRQSCGRCKMSGHTSESCPDQVQDYTRDVSDEQKWVRELMSAPTVDVVEVNKGKSLMQCVASWLERGEKLNMNNPWSKSKRREDALRSRLGYHKAMGMSSVHIGWIGFGVPLVFEGSPPRSLAFKNHRSSQEEEAFVDREHITGVADGSYVVVERKDLLGICPLQVVKHPVSGKMRLVQDLRWINGHLPNVKFRMESLYKELGDVVELGDKLLTTDITKAYYCLAMHPDAQRYLGWMWKGKYYMPTCLVFGLATAPRVFTKIMRPMMAFMRSAGVRVLGMIDDYLWADKPHKIGALKDAVLSVLPNLGWTLNAKCELTPQNEVLMLGMLVNAEKLIVRAPEKKVFATISNISDMVTNHMQQKRITIQDVQRVTGRLMSMMLAFGGVRVFTRDLYRLLAKAEMDNENRRLEGKRLVFTVQLTKEALAELEWWESRLLTHNGSAIASRESQVEVKMTSDASDLGWGGEVMKWKTEAAGVTAKVSRAELPIMTTNKSDVAECMTYGSLPRDEIRKSSTRRELIALLLLAKSPTILEQIRGRRVKVVMDSMPAIRNLINGGGPVHELCDAVKKWMSFCELHNIQPVYEWVPREENARADLASKLGAVSHVWKQARFEDDVRKKMEEIPATQWRKRNNHFIFGKIAVFTPQFHQVDERVEMIRSQLEEAIIVVPRWPAGSEHDWYRRVSECSIACVPLGKMSQWYRTKSQTGHDDMLDAFWLMGRRGEKKRAEKDNVNVAAAAADNMSYQLMMRMMKSVEALGVTGTVPAAAVSNASILPTVLNQKMISSSVASVPLGITKFNMLPLINSNSKEERVKAFITMNQNKNTRKAYESGWSGFDKYLTRESISMNSVKGMDVADYLRERVVEQGVASSTVMGDRAAIADKYRYTPLQGITDEPIVTGVMSVLKVKAQKSKPKQHMAAELMMEILAASDETAKGLKGREAFTNARDTCLMLIMMMGMIREGEAVALRREHIVTRTVRTSNGDVRTLVIIIEQSKTDQVGNGSEVLLGENVLDRSQCPLSRWMEYMSVREKSDVQCIQQSQYAFPTVKGERMSPNTPCKLVQKAVEAANSRCGNSKWGEPSDYGSHSLRRGGATAARLNGVSMMDIKSHGRWSSLAVLGYIGRSSNDVLSVSENFLTGGHGTVSAASNSNYNMNKPQPSSKNESPDASGMEAILKIASMEPKKKTSMGDVEDNIKSVSKMVVDNVAASSMSSYKLNVILSTESENVKFRTRSGKKRKARASSDDEEAEAIEAEVEADRLEDLLFGEAMSQGYEDELEAKKKLEVNTTARKQRRKSKNVGARK